MGMIKSDKKRIVGLFGHHGCGKTTLMDAILKNFDSADRIGQRYLDIEEVEKDKGSTFSNHIVSVDYKDSRFYFFDTPGMADFLGDIDVAVNAVDNVVLVVNASSGVEVTTERIWKIARENKKPIFILINQMDKEGVNFGNVVSELKELFEDGVKVVPLQVPIGEGPEFKGLVNLLTHEAFVYETDQSGKDKKLDEIPAEAKEYYEAYHQELMEDVVETNEALMEKYLEEGEEALNPENVFKALHVAFEDDEVVPIVVASAEKNIGLDRFMEMIYLVGMHPDERTFNAKYEDKELVIEGKEDEPFVGLVVKNAVDPFVGKLTYIRILAGTVKSGDSFVEVQEDSNEKVSHIYIPRFDKNEEVSEAGVGDIIVVPKLKKSKINDTVAHNSRQVKVDVPEFPEPMISKSVKPTSKNEIDKVNNALSKLQESDPTFSWEFDPETGETIVSGLGTTHLEIMIERLKKTFKVNVEVGKPKIAYRETIRRKVKAEYKHKKQTGGHGQYGHVKIELEPLPRGEGYEFVDKIVGGVIPKNFIPSVDKGIKEAMKKGVVAEYPVVDIKVTLYDGSYHEVDSSDIAFQIAARQAFKDGMKNANPVILEPVMKVEIYTPTEYTGDVMGEISSKRGRPMGMQSLGRGTDKIEAEIPLAEMLDFSPRLSSITSGKGYFTMKFSTYQEVTPDIQQKIIQEREREKENQ
ncbi:elongation factor G [Marinitoga sp. 1135]|uniref:Small GTP-binding protein domain protein n=1 Tax=Marinitoga piezophila (strain DSM 14283 / JCM 11233 / KA3) TaxID=443254 RepID=H2J5R4_MARPK|nr:MULTISPECIES: elongation factor G [Marinitoga]AEX85050.1 small GTP-binding protein domain protein [Marinitoga piezophila KA3]APT75558.1 elongation factor G [Marinitoga sp. 1137]NUU95269.1 elongation factor G [Marinitoga sp. 1135]NUU97203.1 elongation factor G [Marinitoga sp. 1138]